MIIIKFLCETVTTKVTDMSCPPPHLCSLFASGLLQIKIAFYGLSQTQPLRSLGVKVQRVRVPGRMK